MTRVSFEHVAILEAKEPMVCLNQMGFLCVPVYFHNGWAKDQNIFLRERLAKKLLEIELVRLEPKGFRWVVYDGFRSRETQAAIYEYYYNKFSYEDPGQSLQSLSEKTQTFVTIPDTISRIPPHTTGGSVDLGLYDLTTGQLIELGADFDEFVPAVVTDYFEQSGCSQGIRDLRRFMNDILADVGVASDVDEFFHKDFGNQKWAAHLNLTVAPYGEVISCSLGQKGEVITVYAVDLSTELLHERLTQLTSGLRLNHPAVIPPSVLPQPRCLFSDSLRAYPHHKRSFPGR